jgi:hypothetical protein
MELVFRITRAFHLSSANIYSVPKTRKGYNLFCLLPLSAVFSRGALGRLGFFMFGGKVNIANVIFGIG